MQTLFHFLYHISVRYGKREKLLDPVCAKHELQIEAFFSELVIFSALQKK